jgi:hypothetical protein
VRVGTTESIFATAVTITWANAAILKCTGEATSNNDIVQHMAEIVGRPGI